MAHGINILTLGAYKRAHGRYAPLPTRWQSIGEPGGNLTALECRTGLICSWRYALALQHGHGISLVVVERHLGAAIAERRWAPAGCCAAVGVIIVAQLTTRPITR